jgi:hypothetical protein
LRKLLLVEVELSKTQHSLTVFAELKVDLVELAVLLGVDVLEPSFVEDSTAKLPDLLGGSFHVNAVM